MLVVPSIFGGLGDTNLTAANRIGTGVTASSTIHTKGSYASLIDPTTRPSSGFWLRVSAVSGSNTDTSMLLDIAYGPTGGGSEEILVLDLDVGSASAGTGFMGKFYYFPIYVPSGVRVSARCQALISSDTCSVAIHMNQDSQYPFSAGKCETYGENEATSSGTSVTPASGSFGSWTQIGAGTDPVETHKFWTVGYGSGADSTMGGMDVLVEIGTGPDSSNVTTIGRFNFSQSGNEGIEGPIPMLVYQPVLAGGELWARIASAETDARSVIIYGIG